MGISQKDMINSLSNLLNWLEQENNWGTNNGELKFLTGRIGEIYVAIMTNGLMAEKTNQNGYDVVSESGEKISVKATTCMKGTHNFRFNKNTLNEVDRIVLVYVNVEEVSVTIIYNELKSDAEKLMNNSGRISMSKVINRQKTIIKNLKILDSVNYKNYRIIRLENGKIQVFDKGVEINPTKPILKIIAKKIGVDINNSNSSMKNTRVLGWDIIKQLK